MSVFNLLNLTNYKDSGTSNFVQREYDSSLEHAVQVAEVVDSALKFQVYTLNM